MTSNIKGSKTTSATDLTTGTLDGDRLPALSTTKKGGVPATGTPSGLFLKDDGSWATAGGGTLSDSVTYETSFGASPNAGIASTSSRGDHTHGTPADPVPTHEVLTTGIHGVGASTIESATGSQAKVDAHKDLTTGVHGAGASTIATVANITTHAGVTSTVHNFDASGDAPAQSHNNTKHSATYIVVADVTDANMTTTDVVTNDVGITKHGFAPKVTNTSNYLKGDGTWSLPTAAAADINPNLLVQASDYTLNSNYGLYITDNYEIGNTYYLELSNNSVFEIG